MKEQKQTLFDIAIAYVIKLSWIIMPLLTIGAFITSFYVGVKVLVFAAVVAFVISILMLVLNTSLQRDGHTKTTQIVDNIILVIFLIALFFAISFVMAALNMLGAIGWFFSLVVAFLVIVFTW